MMPITIRPAGTADLDAVAAIEEACFPAAEAATREKEGIPVGFINGCVTAQRILTDDLYESTVHHDDAAANMMVFGLDVIPKEQHHGIAAQLMQTYIALAKERHKALITLTCKKRLISFYEQFGYVCEGKSTSIHGGAVWYNMTMYLKSLFLMI